MKTKKNNIFSSLRGFLMLWGSQSVSSLGTAMTEYALVVWSYAETGSASSVTLLTLSTFVPTILFRFLAGAIADRWDKKSIMLLADFVAACGTVLVLVLYMNGTLRTGHLYTINVLLSLMNAFQVPASYVATSLLVPKEHYTRTGGLQTASGALISILAPALGSVLLAFGGLTAVLAVDLLTFAVAFGTLVFIPIPKPDLPEEAAKEPFLQNCLSGLKYLKEHAGLLRLIVYIAVVNLLAKLGSDGLMSAFVLARTGGSETTLGLVQSSVAIGLILGGSFIAAQKKPAEDSVRAVIHSCLFIFLTGMGLALGRGPVVWCLFAALTYAFAAVMNAHWGNVMRTAVPLHLHGRVFSARDTLQNCLIPLGLYLGGVLADHVFEPLMQTPSPVKNVLAPVFGSGAGAGIAVQFFLVSLIGLILSLLCKGWIHSETVIPPQDSAK